MKHPSSLAYQFLEAAKAFTKALDLIEDDEVAQKSASLRRQAITLRNNRSAMYEKGGMPELSLEDCRCILAEDPGHAKARTRLLRLLEQLGRWEEALVHVCASQLLFMQEHRNSMRMGLPVPPPPVPQSKMEEILTKVLPDEMAKYTDTTNGRPLPSKYTIVQLLRSYSGYNAWMGQAAKDGNVTVTAEDGAVRVSELLKRGRRYVYDGDYEKATADFEEACSLVDKDSTVADDLPEDDHARLLEWTGMVRHWHFDLDSALKCYTKCADLEPTNPLILVKKAGVLMDGGKQDEAMKCFSSALGLDSSAVDALFHRSNLYMLQQKPTEARRDLEGCLKLRPNHVMARLRLASILAATNDFDGASKQLDMAEQADPLNSEIYSYRGELHFTKSEMDDALRCFEKAMSMDSINPTPYVNAAMAILNTPPTAGQIPDTGRAIELLEKSLEIDPQFAAAYIQLGQLKLGTAVNLDAAREVVELYDVALEKCRSPEEIRELCSMRILAVSQVEAASMLKMETFNMQ